GRLTRGARAETSPQVENDGGDCEVSQHIDEQRPAEGLGDAGLSGKEHVEVGVPRHVEAVNGSEAGARESLEDDGREYGQGRLTLPLREDTRRHRATTSIIGRWSRSASSTSPTRARSSASRRAPTPRS